jgi:hypothetical protein
MKPPAPIKKMLVSIQQTIFCLHMKAGNVVKEEVLLEELIVEAFLADNVDLPQVTNSVIGPSLVHTTSSTSSTSSSKEPASRRLFDFNSSVSSNVSWQMVDDDANFEDELPNQSINDEVCQPWPTTRTRQQAAQQAMYKWRTEEEVEEDQELLNSVVVQQNNVQPDRWDQKIQDALNVLATVCHLPATGSRVTRRYTNAIFVHSMKNAQATYKTLAQQWICREAELYCCPQNPVSK